MRIKLAYKIFIAFLLTSFMVVALMVGIMRFYVARNFTDYVNNAALERLGELKAELATEYQTHQGWQRLRDNHLLWEKILRSNIPRKEFVKRRPPPDLSDVGTNADGGSSQGRPPPLSRDRLHRFARGLALFDAQKQHIVGGPPGLSAANYTLGEISLNSNTVGWLGLHKREHLKNRLVVAFLKQQSRAYYLIGGPILLLAAIVAFLLSRHFLSPIRKLTAGTRALSARKFNSRINVQSNDELGQLAEDFNRMAQTLEKYEKMRQQWISDISHELRTPLSVLRGELEAVQDGVREMNRETLDSLHAEVLQVSKIVNDLHELSLADSGSFSLNNAPIDPLLILKNTLRNFRTRFEKQQIDLQEDLASEAPLRILGDADRLTQVFANLLENTLRYANAPGSLRVWIHRAAKQLTLYFDDSGPGVPAESLAHLFDRLYRVDKSRSRTRGGTGLGLSICKSIVDNLGGDIRAAASPSGGLRIEIMFPLI